MPRVAVVGNLARDVVDGGAPSPGGCPFFAAEAFKRLGEDGQIVTRFAERDRDLFEPALEALDAPVTLLAAEATSGFSLDYEGEDRAMGVTGDRRALAARRCRGARRRRPLGACRTAPPQRLPRRDARGARRRPQALARRTGSRARTPASGRSTTDADFDPAVLASVTTLKLSEEEARIVAGGAVRPRERSRRSASRKCC